MHTPTLCVGANLYIWHWYFVILQLTASKFASPPLFPPPERQEKTCDNKVYANQVVCKQPLAHTKSNPAVTDKPKKVPPPKPKLPADLAADIRISKKLRSPTSDENVPPAAPSRFTSLRSVSSRGSTPDPDIIPINAPNGNSNRSSDEYENSLVDYENSETIIASLSSSLESQRTSPVQDRASPTTPGHEQKPAVPNRSRSETGLHVTPDKKPSMTRRDRAETVGDVLSRAPSVKPRSLTVTSFPQKKHDYEEINDDIGKAIDICCSKLFSQCFIIILTQSVQYFNTICHYRTAVVVLRTNEQRSY